MIRDRVLDKNIGGFMLEMVSVRERATKTGGEGVEKVRREGLWLDKL